MFVVVYGVEIATNKDDLPDKARHILEMNEMLMIPGWDAFKNIPLVHRLPSWIPGGQIRVHHEMSSQVFDQLAESSFEMTMNAMEDGGHSSMISDLISSLEFKKDLLQEKEIEKIKWMGFQSLAGGSRKYLYVVIISLTTLRLAAADTTMSAISTFFLAMSLYPDVQVKAQRELDQVIGPGKLPTFDDRPSLPYVEAVYREVMRWHPALPTGKFCSSLCFAGSKY
ncbi:hypothetical protein VKT23_018149 [Stygiomarasmius scandens]|uniref:Cytochrome P450 n=1 Tax=Marasmiellus scandens TaxID=2682957 RepID=A0ABR1IUA0_9AGAR